MAKGANVAVWELTDGGIEAGSERECGCGDGNSLPGKAEGVEALAKEVRQGEPGPDYFRTCSLSSGQPGLLVRTFI